jgi:hypothetical protein
MEPTRIAEDDDDLSLSGVYRRAEPPSAPDPWRALKVFATLALTATFTALIPILVEGGALSRGIGGGLAVLGPFVVCLGFAWSFGLLDELDTRGSDDR